MKKALVGIALLTILVLGFLIIKVNNLMAKISLTSHTPTFNLNNPLSQRFTQKKPFSILGLGYAGGTHEGAYLTDSLMLISVNPALKKITLISIPRDIYIYLPTDQVGSDWKINDSYVIGMNDKDFPNKPKDFTGKTGGANLSKYAVQQVTGIKPDFFASADFASFRKAIDSMGGVDVNIKQSFEDPQYPIDGHEDDLCGHTEAELSVLVTESPEVAFPCRYEHLDFKQGTQHMNGTTALKYVRSRHSSEDGTDFGRSQRQRHLLLAVKNKVLSYNFVTNILPLIDSFGDGVRTDLNISEMYTLFLHATELKSYSVESIALTNSNVLQDSTDPQLGYILIPKDGVGEWSGVQQWIKEQM
jgi:anionic cell wall polymer biosynthesis LytR-Cps2A-Psr (LCP) family protein